MNEPLSMTKSTSYSLENAVKPYDNDYKFAEESDDGIPIAAFSKSVSYPNTNNTYSYSSSASDLKSIGKPLKSKSSSHENKRKKARFSANDKKTKKSKKRRARNKALTNKFLAAVNVGQTVKLTKSRVGFVRFKGKVKFGIGTWYGLEIYDSLTKTRHNGTVFGKRYFNCPRNKGLFCKRDIITQAIPAQKIKKVLKELEQKQIKAKKLKETKNTKLNGHKHIYNNSILALYQQEFYGNNRLMVKLDDENEQKIKKDFKRFQRLSFMASNNADIMSMIQKDNEDEKKGDEEKESAEDEGADPHKDIDIDSEAWDSFKERPIIELIESDNEMDLCQVRLFYEFELYFRQFEYVFNKGLFIKSIDTKRKQGRALILECGIQGDNGWYITGINDENINKYSKPAVQQILDKLLPDIGYDITLRKLG